MLQFESLAVCTHQTLLFACTIQHKSYNFDFFFPGISHLKWKLLSAMPSYFCHLLFWLQTLSSKNRPFDCLYWPNNWWFKYVKYSYRKVWISGGASSNVVSIICSPVWDSNSDLTKTGGTPAIPSLDSPVVTMRFGKPKRSDFAQTVWVSFYDTVL